MGLFSGQWADVIEWTEYRDDVLFWVWRNKEIKKGSRLVIKPGQDAVFIYNGRIEGVFKDEGSFEVASDIVPFLSSLKGFKFGFRSGLRAEVMFVNTKEMLVKWGTKNEINVPAEGMPGGLPVRAFGTMVIKASDYIAMIDKIAGMRQMFTVEDVRERVTSVLDQLLMKWIPREGHDMFNLQANAQQIAAGIREDLDMDMTSIGISVVDFTISSFNYPPEVQEMINKNAAYGMVGDVKRFRDVGMVDAASSGKSGAMADSMGAAMGMMAGMNMAKEMNEPTGGGKFCPNCGSRLPSPSPKFCPECGKKL